jgi:isopenicillin N synthase-like dioxygenase
MTLEIPIINILPLADGTDGKYNVAKSIGDACRTFGFFYIVGHGVDESLQSKLELLSKKVFSLPLEEKLKIKMEHGGIAWRGYFPLGNELTSGKPDMKEGIYFGQELDNENPLVKNQTLLHGRNLFPDEISEFRETILTYMTAMTSLAHILMEGIAISLGLDEKYFYERYTKDPLQLFRIFNYPATKISYETEVWGVGEHTDYGLLTILKQDNSGGLQVKSQSKWIEAPPIENSFICNIGDMLDHMTGGFFRSTPHRVKCQTKNDRLSFPFFYDPNFFAQMKLIEGIKKQKDDKDDRWDKTSVHKFSGTYGEYLLKKVSKVFPELKSKFLE